MGGGVAVEEVRMRLRRKLEGMLGDDEAAMLMDRPPGGWSDLVTNQSLGAILDERFASLELRLENRFDRVDHRFDHVAQGFETYEHKLTSRMDELARDQTWRMVTALLTGMTILTAAFSVLLVITSR